MSMLPRCVTPMCQVTFRSLYEGRSNTGHCSNTHIIMILSVILQSLILSSQVMWYLLQCQARSQRLEIIILLHRLVWSLTLNMTGSLKAILVQCWFTSNLKSRTMLENEVFTYIHIWMLYDTRKILNYIYYFMPFAIIKWKMI